MQSFVLVSCPCILGLLWSLELPWIPGMWGLVCHNNKCRSLSSTIKRTSCADFPVSEGHFRWMPSTQPGCQQCWLSKMGFSWAILTLDLCFPHGCRLCKLICHKIALWREREAGLINRVSLSLQTLDQSAKLRWSLSATHSRAMSIEFGLAPILLRGKGVKEVLPSLHHVASLCRVGP